MNEFDSTPAVTEPKNATPNTLKDVMDNWITCRQELTQLNLKLISLCQNDKNLRWLKSRGYFYFLDH